MNELFGRAYAAAYDLLYRDKDYDRECALLEKVFHDYEIRRVRKILDAGCGTGSHALGLMARGYEVVGVERSAEMGTLADEKARRQGRSFRRYTADLRTVDLKETFDAVLMMFAVLGYQLEDSEVAAALRNARRHLSTGGLLIFDVWYGPAVLIQRPEDRVRKIETGEGTLLRTAATQLDLVRQRCVVDYRLRHTNGEQIFREARETHVMRYFFPKELEFFLETTGFTLLRIGKFPEFAGDPDETSWNVLVAARAV